MKRMTLGLDEDRYELIAQASDAIRRYYQAKELGVPSAEIEKLKQLVDTLCQSIADWNPIISNVDGPLLDSQQYVAEYDAPIKKSE